jgi:hypothetical protein
MELFTNETIPELLEKSLETARLTDSGWVDVGYELGSSAGRGIYWLTFEDARASVVDDVRRIREHPLVPKRIPIYRERSPGMRQGCPFPRTALNETHPLIAQSRFRPFSDPVQMIPHTGRIDCFGYRPRVFQQVGGQFKGDQRTPLGLQNTIVRAGALRAFQGYSEGRSGIRE